MEDKNLRVGSLVLSIVIFIMAFLSIGEKFFKPGAITPLAPLVLFGVFMLLGIYYGSSVYLREGGELKAVLFYIFALWSILTYTADQIIYNPLSNYFFLTMFLLIALQSYILLTLYEREKR